MHYFLMRVADSWACVLPAGCGVLAEMVDMEILRNPLFMLICASNVLGMLGFYVPFVYIVDTAVNKVSHIQCSLFPHMRLSQNTCKENGEACLANLHFYP